ncbi:MAG TPA: DUF445 domain-containing protein [Sphingomonas sp.]|uniref:DUF445 domain-containing protein n=1 Tax=Sphingomonas sp. TaxID=28214 RepID=UPI002EDA8AE7
MRIVATGLLVSMAALYGLTRWLEPQHAGWGYVRAFAEAAMVGGLADWFAVTALFRHPLGLPIPHTAIIPRNKDRIGATLASFLKDNFLTPRVVARRMRRVDVAGAAGRFLSAPSEGGRMRAGASRLVANILESLDQDRLGGMAKGAIAARLRALNAAPLIGQALAAAMQNKRHMPVLDALISWGSRMLLRNEETVRAMVSQRSGSILRWTGLDERIGQAVIDGLYKLLDDMASDPDHPLRIKAEEGLAQLAWDLQRDPAMQARVDRIRDELLDNPAVAAWIAGLWESARAGLLRAARDPEAALAGKLGEMLRQLGGTLQQDPRLGRTINSFVRRAAVGAVATYGDQIVKLVSETIRGWDARTITARLENAVGRDLQYIRVNGTVVGGLVGVLIHLVDRVAG